MTDNPTGRRPTSRWATLLVAVVPLALAAPLAQGKDEALQPYKARYQVTFRGLSGGQIESSLSRDRVPGQWLYETRAFPSLPITP